MRPSGKFERSAWRADLLAGSLNVAQKKRLERRFKDPKDPLKIVIVRDMWLTGFDAPCCHTMYVDKPMAGHNLMQAIARVNRVFAGKEGGLVVDYIGIAAELKNALKTYTDAKGKGNRGGAPHRRAGFSPPLKKTCVRQVALDSDVLEPERKRLGKKRGLSSTLQKKQTPLWQASSQTLWARPYSGSGIEV